METESRFNWENQVIENKNYFPSVVAIPLTVNATGRYLPGHFAAQ